MVPTKCCKCGSCTCNRQANYSKEYITPKVPCLACSSTGTQVKKEYPFKVFEPCEVCNGTGMLDKQP